MSKISKAISLWPVLLGIAVAARAQREPILRAQPIVNRNLLMRPSFRARGRKSWRYSTTFKFACTT